MKVTTQAFLAALFLVTSIATARGDDKAEGSPGAIDEFVDGAMKKQHIPGASVAVIKDGKVILSKGYGLANVELSVPATEHTAYQLASVTKTFTATAIMLLVKDGKIKLEDSITKLVPDLPKAWDPVTVKHLLNHTSGIKSYTNVKDFFKTIRKDYTHREILDLVAKEPLEFEPGERWNYSNTGYFLLGMLIEKVAGQSYPEFMEARIFKPLDMTETRVNDLRVIIPNRAHGYTMEGKTLKNGEYVSPTQPYAAGALISTVSDLVKWDAGLAAGTLLDKTTLETMWAPAELKGGKHADYGLGWSVSKVNGHRLASHGGGIPGFSTQLSRYVDDKLTIIVLTNLDGGGGDSLARGIAAKIIPALARKASEPIADKDPKTTELLKGILLGAQKGELKDALFTETAQKEMLPKIRDDKERLAGFGALKSIDLLARKESDQDLRLHYRVIFENERLEFFATLTKDGKVAGLGIRTED